eukprot:CAMPEP_0168730154 /NCGR_PEP_ID=MMETSP0724-20121128/6587_1 /TAXON_ID=265536 /ORGANISM="Amphiprora sp., Strain CCMP467" /LENGTH=335 /DNA_ID=CAMNT_0008777089 /DNA_START=34 /DNA_END=1041 /DNA_ORIENTATION=-
MSQRRGAPKPSISVNSTAAVAEPLELDRPSPHVAVDEEESVPLSNNATTDGGGGLADRARLQIARVKKWKESSFAVALTEPTWEAEQLKQSAFWGDDKAYRIPRSVSNYNNDDDDDDDDDQTDIAVHPDTTGCLCCSAMLCPYFGAGRVGNMVVLRSTMEKVEEVDEDLETGEVHVRRYTRPKLLCVLGPYWPMLLFVTYPLILVVSGWAYYVAIRPENGVSKPFPIVFGWTVLTAGLIVALALTGCRDPGILYKHDKPPAQHENSWRWSDHTQTYRPRGAHFDADTAVVVEEFDHTCPWTGTAIGKKNMPSFQAFVCLVFICLIMNIFLITGAL